jgi:hypothetical protein
MTRLEGEKVQIEEHEGRPTISGLPEEAVVMFLARLHGWFNNGDRCDGEYGVIYGPKTCLPDQNLTSELWSAKVAIGKSGHPLKIWRVRHGHLYQSGGGLVEFGKENYTIANCDQIFFRRLDNPQKSTFNGEEIQEVYSVL